MNPDLSKSLFRSICFTLILLQQSLFAQKAEISNGYYISSKGDSLSGQIYFGDIRYNILKFRSSNQDPWTNLSPQLVKVVAGEKELHILSKEIRTSEGAEYIFVQRVLEGGYSLYKANTSKDIALFFVQMPEDKNLVKINPLGYGSQLKSLLDSCGQKLAASNLRYTAESLSRYFVQANQCAYPDTKKSTIKNKIKPRLGIGLSAMYYNINPTVGENTIFSGDYKNVGRFNGGVSVRLQINTAFSFHVGLNYVDKRIKSDSVLLKIKYYREEPGYLPYYDKAYYRFAPDLNFTYWEIPIGFTHSFLPDRKLSPSYSFGFTVQIPNTQKIEHDWGYPICVNSPGQVCFLPPGEVGHISPIWAKANKDARVNFFVGLGLRKTLKSKNEWELRVDYYNQLEKAKAEVSKIGIANLFMRTSRFQASVNYYFYFKKGVK